MILAQNHLLPLNGSRLIFVSFMLAATLSSCELFKKVDSEKPKDVTNKQGELDPVLGRKVYDPATGTYIIVDNAAPTERMDTLKFRDNPTDLYPPITSSQITYQPDDRPKQVEVIGSGGDGGSQRLSSYNAAILLPFFTNKADNSSKWAINFYGGMKIALEDLKALGVNMRVDVFDTDGEANTVGSLLNTKALQSAHLIIGPIKTENVKLVADFSKKNGKVFVSPYSAASNLSPGNDHYIQVNPSLRTHCEAVTADALSRFSREKIVLISRDIPGEKESFNYFQQANYKSLGRSDESKRFKEFVVSTSADFNQSDLLSLMQVQDTAVFLVPSWSEQFVKSLVQKLSTSKSSNTYIAVYGMPQWADFDDKDAVSLRELDVRITANQYMTSMNSEIQAFRLKFFSEFGSLPTHEAVQGYDVMYYFGKMIHKYGTKFQFSLEKEPADRLMHTTFDFERNTQYRSGTQGEFGSIDQFENKYLNILEFNGYRYVRVK